MKKVTVVIPVYNVEKYLEACLDSVIDQTLKDIEIICVNDGSTDKSLNILKKYAQKDDRIVIIDKKNGGLSSSRNKGIENATGEYIIFLDSDDYLTTNALEELYNLSKKNKLDTIYFDANTVYETKELEESQSKFAEYYIRDKSYDKVLSGQDLYMEMEHDFRVNVPLQMNKTALLKDNNIKFIEGIIHEDEAFSIEVTLHSKRAMHVANDYYQRRVRDDSIMTNANQIRSSYGYFRAFTDILPKIAKYVDSEEKLVFYTRRLNLLRRSAAKAISYIPEDELTFFRITEDKEEYLKYKFFIRDYAFSRKSIVRLEKELKKYNSLKKGLKGVFSNRFPKLKNRIKALVRIHIPNLIHFYNRNPKVSVIMPVYNGEKYLRECLDSVRKQSLKRIEIICVDDESTDSSWSILEEYQEKDKRFKIFKQEHSNAGNARNLGLKNAKGEYLLFLDSDDFFDKHLCKKTYKQAKIYKADIVLFATDRIYMDTEDLEKKVIPLNSLIPEGRAFKPQDLQNKLFQLTTSCPWSKLFRRKFVIQKGLKYQSCTNSNDVFFTRTALTQAKRIVGLNEPLVTYRANLSTSTQGKKDKNPLAFYNAYKAVKEFLIGRGIYETYKRTLINTVINEAVWNYNTFKTKEAKETVIDIFKKKGIKEFEIYDLPIYEIDNFGNYEQFKKIFGTKSIEEKKKTTRKTTKSTKTTKK